MVKKNVSRIGNTFSNLGGVLKVSLASMVGALSTFSANAEDYSLSIGGYVKLDGIYSRYSDGGIGAGSAARDFYIPGTIPVGGESEGGAFDFHIKETRINVKTKRKIDDKEVTAFVEMDFMLAPSGDERISNSYQPRVRHAFFSYDKWLFGQTWSTFQNVGALAENLDFVGPAEGTVFARQAMARYTHNQWQFAVENSETTVSTAAGRVVTDDAAVPDLVARYTFDLSSSQVVIAAVARQLTYKDQATDVDETETGFGISASAKFKFGRNDLRMMITSGEGLGRYLGLNTANDAELVNGQLEAISSSAGFISYRHLWSDQWRSNFTYSAFSADYDAPLSQTSTKSTNSVHVNLLYSPTQRITLGGEVIRASRKLVSGDSGNMNRLQFSAKYAF